MSYISLTYSLTLFSLIYAQIEENKLSVPFLRKEGDGGREDGKQRRNLRTGR